MKEIPINLEKWLYCHLIHDLLMPSEYVAIVVAFLSNTQAKLLLEAANWMMVCKCITWFATDA